MSSSPDEAAVTRRRSSRPLLHAALACAAALLCAVVARGFRVGPWAPSPARAAYDDAARRYRDGGARALIEPQLPQAAQAGRSSGGAVFNGTHSLPPAPHTPADALASRLVVAVAVAVHGGARQVTSPLTGEFLHSFLATAAAHHVYRLYFAFDEADGFYSRAAVRTQVSEAVRLGTEAAERDRGLPSGALLVSAHWVACAYTGKPAWAQSDAVMAAYSEGADYAYRTNDDSVFPYVHDWVDRFIAELRGRSVPNVGVVGPRVQGEPAYGVMTHDFTHRTHALVFGAHYPRALPTWSADDWITWVYRQFEGHDFFAQLRDVLVLHDTTGSSRYTPDSTAVRTAALNSELAAGAVTLAAWLLAQRGVNATATVRWRQTCCP